MILLLLAVVTASTTHGQEFYGKIGGGIMKPYAAVSGPKGSTRYDVQLVGLIETGIRIRNNDISAQGMFTRLKIVSDDAYYIEKYNKPHVVYLGNPMTVLTARYNLHILKLIYVGASGGIVIFSSMHDNIATKAGDEASNYIRGRGWTIGLQTGANIPISHRLFINGEASYKRLVATSGYWGRNNAFIFLIGAGIKI